MPYVSNITGPLIAELFTLNFLVAFQGSGVDRAADGHGGEGGPPGGDRQKEQARPTVLNTPTGTRR